MSFVTHTLGAGFKVGSLGLLDGLGNKIEHSFDPKLPGPPPAPPNPNDAANAAQSLTDQMRLRRGLLSNIVAGGNASTSSTPAVGKTQLGV